jgi:hemolysin activation/secretion protein
LRTGASGCPTVRPAPIDKKIPLKKTFLECGAQRRLVILLLGVCPALPVWAAPPPSPPGAGTILQQAQPTPPPAPASNNSGLNIEQSPNSTPPDSAPFPVTHFEITGNSRIDTATLHALIASAEGTQLTLRELFALTGRITDFYHSHGYPLARAIIPTQTLHDGVVRIEVIEAHYGKVSVNNQGRVNDGLLQSTLAGLHSGAVVTQAPLDRSLLLLSDIPGVVVNAALKPGEAVGSSDLHVDVSSPRLIIGSVTADDDGDRYTGRGRVGGTVSLLDPLHRGDVLSLNALTSGSDMNYGRVSYDALLDGEGTRVGVGYSALHYRLGGRLSDLDASGDAQDASLWVKQPLVRSRDLSVYAQIQYDHLRLNDDVGASALETRRHLDNLTASLDGDVHDGLLAGAVNTWSASWTYGHVGFDNAGAESADAASADTQGDFSKWNVTLGRLQSFNANDALYLQATGQWANGNLDPSQQFIVGGSASVRAYDVSALSADTGYQLTAELRHTYPEFWYGRWQTIAFVDAAHASVNRTTFAPGLNTASFYGAGGGLNWAGPDNWNASVTLATPFGARPELVGDTSSVRAWAQVSKAF